MIYDSNNVSPIDSENSNGSSNGSVLDIVNSMSICDEPLRGKTLGKVFFVFYIDYNNVLASIVYKRTI